MAPRRRSLRAQNKTTNIGTSALIALSGITCSRSTPPNPTTSSSSVIVNVSASVPSSAPTAPAPNEDAAHVVQKFVPYVVTLPNIARRTLYTWTKTDQIEALAKDPTLLTRYESPELGTSYFEQVLEQRAQKSDSLAKLLRSAAFAKQRYAWVAPFATSVGIGDENYGDELIQIVLKPEAWFVIVKMRSTELTVVDMHNKSVAMADALAHPERLAAAYFVQDQPATGYRASMAGPNERIGYREYVLFNESMIASYSVGTPEITAEVEAEIQALESLLHYLETHETHLDYWNKWMVDVVTKRWTSPPNVQSPVEAYEASIAFADDIYQPDKRSSNKLIETLRKRQLRNKPFTHVPTVTFSAQAKGSSASPSSTTKPTKKPKGTY